MVWRQKTTKCPKHALSEFHNLLCKQHQLLHLSKIKRENQYIVQNISATDVAYIVSWRMP